MLSVCTRADGDIEDDRDRLRLGGQRCRRRMARSGSRQDDVAHRVGDGLPAALNSIHTYCDALVRETAGGKVEDKRSMSGQFRMSGKAGLLTANRTE
jgi:hypothetical protein